MASTADIQVNAKRGRTTQELHREALPETQRGRGRGGSGWKQNRRFRSQDSSLSLSLSPPFMPRFGQKQTGTPRLLSFMLYALGHVLTES